MTVTETNSRGQKMAIVEMDMKVADELLKSLCIKIGWVNYGVWHRITIPHCYSCFRYGHHQVNSEDETEGIWSYAYTVESQDIRRVSVQASPSASCALNKK